MKKNKNIKKLAHKVLIIVLSVFLLISVCFTLLELFHITNFLNQPNISSNTTDTPSIKSDFNNGKERVVTPTNKNEGTITDTNGDALPTNPNSEWSYSVDGSISVYLPAKNSILSSGQTLSGKSTKGDISFRLIDNVSGVIAQGKISTVDNKFSGIFDFTTTATEGRLDIFVADADGVESSVVEIPVRFN